MTTPTATFYFASTSLDLRQADKPDEYPQDIYIKDVCYRKIDPLYFAWLRCRMETAQRAFDSGGLPKDKWDELRGRFNRLQEWAIGHYGKEALQAVIREFDPADYYSPVNRQPEPFLFPKTGDWNCTEWVSPVSVRKVDAIRDHALSLGWSEARLYRNRGRFRFPLGEDYGLVCFLEENQRIGEVTRRYIEIVGPPPRENILRFHNPDVDQPWLKKSEATQ